MSKIKNKWDLCLVFVFLCLSLLLEHHELFSLIEDQTMGIRQLLRMSFATTDKIIFPQEDIVLVTIDETFFDWYNAFPLRRQDIAKLIRNVNQFEPKILAVDLLFKYNSAYDDDHELADAVSSSNAILASQAIFEDSNQFKKIHYPAKTIGKDISSGYINHTSTSNTVTTLSRLRIYPEITQHPFGWPFAIQVLARYYNSTPVLEDHILTIGPHKIPLNQFNEFYIDFPVIPSGNTFLHEFAGITAKAFMDYSPDDHMELSYWIKDKIVIIGDTFEVSQDWFDTPVGTMFGSEFIATTISTLLNGAPLKPASTFAEFLSVLFLLSLITFACYRIHDPRLRVIMVIIIYIAFFMGCSIFYVYFGIIFAVSYPLMAGVLSFAGINLKFYLREQKLKARAEKNFQKIFENAVEGIFQATPDGKFITANPSMANILDYPSPDDLFKDITNLQDQLFIYPLDFRDFDRFIRQERQISNFETRLRTRTGRKIWVSISARIHYQLNFEVAYYEGFVVDITLRKKAEENLRNLNMGLEDRVQKRTKELKNTVDELSHTQQLVNRQNLKLHQTLTALKESEERYRGLYDSSKDGIFFLGMQMRFLDANPAFEKMLGYALQDLKQLYLRQVTPLKWQSIENKIIDTQIFSGCNSQEYEKEFIHADGHTFPVSIRAWLLTHETGQPTGIWGIAKDISEKKRADHLREDVERMVRHDLKTPLNGIIGLSKRLQYEENINHQQRNWVNMINESGQQILHMIEYSLDIYKMEEGTYHLKPKAVDLVRLFHRLNEELNLWEPKKNISLAFFIGSKPLLWDTLYWVAGEEVLLASLFSNLIKNAIEASPENETVNILINESNMHEIEIQNKGVISEKIQDRFFERYATAGKQSGTGIGTYSAKLIAKTHAGDITFTSNENKGTSLIVRLPKKASLEIPPQETEFNENALQIKSNQLNILTVDDHPNNHIVMSFFFDETPYIVTYVDSGKKALKKIQESTFDVILMDLNMPEMNGFDCTQAIRDMNIQTPIIALSADASKQTVSLCKERGFNDFLAKPVQSRDDLMAIIEENIKQ
ncbi:PAS/PAC sensor hybrid histidine kinase [Candidatus Magnetomorum sp. HK-1]|nr:PAS/PAC sensor hybrid histidine kinase [Candidatus Magnetomorum sp. HK-1]